MNTLENLKVTGKLGIKLYDSTGNLKDSRDINNLVVTTGLTYIASRMKDTAKAAMGWIQLGTDSTAAAAGNTIASIVTTGLSGTTRKALTSTTPSTSSIVYIASWAAGEATGAVTEAGICNVASGTTGDLLCRTVFSVINKGANDTMQITWTINLAAV